tara:strand:+ start:691 stop:984 length:294 start_codon:yes stop_codon:yes gene_type:complete
MTTTTTMTLAETLAFQVKLLREQHDSAKLHAARSIIKLPAEIARLTKISADKGLALIERIKSGDPPSRRALEAAIVETAATAAWAAYWVEGLEQGAF